MPYMYSGVSTVKPKNLNEFTFTPPAWGSNYIVKFEWIPPVTNSRHDLGAIVIKQIYLHAAPILDKIQDSNWYDEEDLKEACFAYLSALR